MIILFFASFLLYVHLHVHVLSLFLPSANIFLSHLIFSLFLLLLILFLFCILPPLSLLSSLSLPLLFLFRQVRGNTHLAGRGISIGSEVSGGVEDVLIEDVVVIGPSEHGLHIKTSASRGGYVRNIVYRNISLGNIVDDKVSGLFIYV